MRTRIWMVALVASMLLGLITACSGGGKSDSQSSSPPASSSGTGAATPAGDNPYAKHVELSLAIWDVEQAFPAGQKDEVYEFLQNKFNVSFKPVNVTWDDYEQKLQVWAASSQLPDVFVIDAMGKPYYNTWIQEKLIRPIPDDLSKYPNVKTLLDNPDLQGFKHSDGKFYSLPKPNYSNSYENGAEKAIYYRKDWMESVGITKAPENAEQFITLLNAFKQQDPDGKKTIGFTAYDGGHFMNMALSYAPGLGGGANHWIKEGGKWVPALLADSALPALKEMHRIYQAGVVDKDIAILKGDEALEKFASGRAGALAYGGIPSFQMRIKEYWDKNYPDKKFEDSVLLAHYWKAPDGVYYRNTAEYSWSENYFNADTMDDAKMDRYLALHDYLLSDEGMNLLRYGFEGIDYKRNGDEIEITRPKNDQGEFDELKLKYASVETLTWLVSWDSSFNFFNPSYPEKLREASLKLRDWAEHEAKPVETNFALNYLEYPSKNKVSMLPVDDALKVILSKDPDKSYDEIKKGYYKQGAQQMIDELNAAAESAGIR